MEPSFRSIFNTRSCRTPNLFVCGRPSLRGRRCRYLNAAGTFTHGKSVCIDVRARGGVTLSIAKVSSASETSLADEIAAFCADMTSPARPLMTPTPMEDIAQTPIPDISSAQT